MTETPHSENIAPRLQRIAELAKTMPGAELRTLAHHIDIDFLREAFRRTRKDGAAGVDGQTATAYAADLEKNLDSLLNRAKSGTYRAPAVRRVNIPKGDGSSTRPLGIPTFEDKVLQRAVAMVLEAVYEQDFLDCSYGFRPGRSAHDALETLWEGLMGRSGGWVRSVSEWCRLHRHWKIREQHASLSRKLRGHCAYYGVTGNSPALRRFRHAMERLWLRWLGRRSQRARGSWEWFQQLKRRYPLPPALAIHSRYRRAANP